MIAAVQLLSEPSATSTNSHVVPSLVLMGSTVPSPRSDVGPDWQVFDEVDTPAAPAGSKNAEPPPAQASSGDLRRSVVDALGSPSGAAATAQSVTCSVVPSAACSVVGEDLRDLRGLEEEEVSEIPNIDEDIKLVVQEPAHHVYCMHVCWHMNVCSSPSHRRTLTT